MLHRLSTTNGKSIYSLDAVYMHEVKYLIMDSYGWNNRGFITIHKIGGEPFQSFKLRVIKQLQEKSKPKHPAKFYISSEFNSELQKAFKKGKYEEWRR